MIWIGKGIATVGVWAGACFLGFCGISFLIGPILGLVAGCWGTAVIWNPKSAKSISDWF